MDWLEFVFLAVSKMMPIMSSDYFLYSSALIVVVALVCCLVRLKNVFVD